MHLFSPKRQAQDSQQVSLRVFLKHARESVIWCLGILLKIVLKLVEWQFIHNSRSGMLFLLNRDAEPIEYKIEMRLAVTWYEVHKLINIANEIDRINDSKITLEEAQAWNQLERTYWRNLSSTSDVMIDRVQEESLLDNLIRAIRRWLDSNSIAAASSTLGKDFNQFSLPKLGMIALELLLSEEGAENVIGCLREEYVGKVRTAGLGSAKTWYWKQIGSSVAVFVYERFLNPLKKWIP
jgi:hypothetical protein